MDWSYLPEFLVKAVLCVVIVIPVTIVVLVGGIAAMFLGPLWYLGWAITFCFLGLLLGFSLDALLFLTSMFDTSSTPSYSSGEFFKLAGKCIEDLQDSLEYSSQLATGISEFLGGTWEFFLGW